MIWWECEPDWKCKTCMRDYWHWPAGWLRFSTDWQPHASHMCPVYQNPRAIWAVPAGSPCVLRQHLCTWITVQQKQQTGFKNEKSEVEKIKQLFSDSEILWLNQCDSIDQSKGERIVLLVSCMGKNTSVYMWATHFMTVTDKLTNPKVSEPHHVKKLTVLVYTWKMGLRRQESYPQILQSCP